MGTHLAVVYKNAGEIQKAFIKNISGGGLYIETKELSDVGTMLEIDIELSETPGSDPIQLKLKGIVAWTNPKAIKDLPIGMGIKFAEMDAVSKSKLERLLHIRLDEALFGKKQ